MSMLLIQKGFILKQIKDLFIGLFAIFVTNFICVALMQKYGINLVKLMPYSKLFILFPSINVFFYLLFIVPIVEEFAFRLYLVPKTKYIYISIILIVFIFSDRILSFYEFDAISYSALLVSILVLTVLIIKKTIVKIISFAQNHSLIYYASSVILFFFLHVNYEMSQENFYWIIIALVPQITGGIFLVYYRLKYGIWICLLFHSIYNGLMLLGLNMTN